MKNLLKAATIISKATFAVGDMETDGGFNFFKIDQIETKGANFLLVCCENLDTVALAIDGDISIGSNIMDTGEDGDRTLLYTGEWTFTVPAGAGSTIWTYAIKPNADVDLSNLETGIFDLPFDEYADLTTTNNIILTNRTEIVAPFIPPLIDIIFRAPTTQLLIDMNITVYGMNV